MTFTNPVISAPGVDHGDPAVIKYSGKYYLYHTGPFSIPVYESVDLVNWEKKGTALEASGSNTHWAQIDLWAPEVFYENGVFYMYVTGARKKSDGTADDEKRSIGVAKAAHPLGPFKLADAPLTSEWSIDAHPFLDEDGEMYMFYNVRNDYTLGPGEIIGTGNVVDKMEDLETLAGEPSLVVKPEFLREGNKEGTFFWNEGPFVLKKDNTYYQMYSAGFFGDDTYGLYYATSDTIHDKQGYNSPGWVKYKNGTPILQTNEQCHGPGHHIITKAPDGLTDIAVFHGYVPEEQVQERRVWLGYMEWQENHLKMDPPSKSVSLSPPFPTKDLREINDIEKINSSLKNMHAKDFYFETTLNLRERVSVQLPGVELILDSAAQIWKLESQGKQFTGKFKRKADPEPLHMLQAVQLNGCLKWFLNNLLLCETESGLSAGTIQISGPEYLYGTVFTKMN
ncbi:glycoside hydrolase family 43 protein [Salipaludibacillus aurantiacus]|uniref:Beta-xylosidase, GH43 family n=1 Tax=Salipaludibacillus aurantiacus TaxID=1601833 RepID=A0A1H9VX37_9BACI|nr:glycoside hydrolase family 43 protein [Salipaludibacillus aurantiacus]SES26089.1 Beta-xylosidase, GH43 family [Salipaludibacillus aurantiacus]